MAKNRLSVFIVAFILLFCSGESIFASKIPVEPTILLERKKFGALVIDIEFNRKAPFADAGLQFMKSITDCNLSLLRSSASSKDTLFWTNTSFASDSPGFAQDSIQQLRLFHHEFWENPKGENFDTVYAVVFAKDLSGKSYTYSKQFILSAQNESQKPVRPLEAMFDVEERDSVIIFSSVVKRNRIIISEHYSEKYYSELIISDSSGKPLFKDYKQLPEGVKVKSLPNNENEFYRYQHEWKGNTNDGKSLPIGLYNVKITIPLTTTSLVVDKVYLYDGRFFRDENKNQSVEKPESKSSAELSKPEISPKKSKKK